MNVVMSAQGWEKLINEKFPQLEIPSDDVLWVFDFLGWSDDRKNK